MQIFGFIAVMNKVKNLIDQINKYKTQKAFLLVQNALKQFELDLTNL